MTKILFYGETPCIETGAARVNRYLLEAILESGFEVEVLATSHFMGDEYDHTRYPFSITSVEGENQRETHERAGVLIEERNGTFDILCISADMHVPQILASHLRKHPSIVLAAIDGPVTFPEQVSSLELATWPVVYSCYSYVQVAKVLPGIVKKFKCITLGCEPDVFFPLTVEERRAYRAKAFGIHDDDTFLVMWANRNQMRKDPGRAMAAFHQFHRRVPNSRLYMHARMIDVGGNLASQAQFFGLCTAPPNPEVIFSPPDYTEVAGFDREKLNKMYNAADVCISTSQGEGWGLTTTEAMAAGRPFIGPSNTTFYELLGGRHDGHLVTTGDRGYLAKSGGRDHWSIYYGHDDAPRPITSVHAMAEALYHVYTHREEANEKGRMARAWAEQHTWEGFKDRWKLLLSQVSR